MCSVDQEFAPLWVKVFVFMALIGAPLILALIFLTLYKLKKWGYTKVNDLRLNHIDKLSLIKKLGGISKDKYSLSAEMARRHKMLDDLLCTIHRDGVTI